MTQEQKDNLELSAAMPIISDLGISLCDVIYRGQEEPDILIPNYNGRCIGIEVVSSHPMEIDTNGKQNLCQRKKHLSKLVKDYKEQLYKKGDKYNSLSVHFKPKAYWDWDNDDIILEEIDGCINGKLRRRWQYIYNASRNDVKEENEDLIIITDSNVGIGAKYLWIYQFVDNKNDKLRDYKELDKNKGIDEYWLIVDFVYAQNVDLNKTEQFEIDTEYDRLYLVQYGDVKRLK